MDAESVKKLLAERGYVLAGDETVTGAYIGAERTVSGCCDLCRYEDVELFLEVTVKAGTGRASTFRIELYSNEFDLMSY